MSSSPVKYKFLSNINIIELFINIYAYVDKDFEINFFLIFKKKCQNVRTKKCVHQFLCVNKKNGVCNKVTQSLP